MKGRDFAYAERGGNGITDAARVAEETIQLRPDIIIAPATLEAVAAKNATSTIPIICPALADAVHLGLIASEARPGGNVTGVEPYIGGLPAKQIDLAREIVPDATKIGLLTNDVDPKGAPQGPELKAAAQALGLEIVSANADRPEEIEAALQTLANEKVDVAIVLQTNLFFNNRPPPNAAQMYTTGEIAANINSTITLVRAYQNQEREIVEESSETKKSSQVVRRPIRLPRIPSRGES